MLNLYDDAANGGEPRKIDPHQAHAASAAGRGVLLDVRDEHLFDNAHIEPAVPLPFAELEAAGGHLPARIRVPEDALLILYCA